MLHFVLTVLLTVSLYLLLRAFPRYGVHSLHAVLFNYFSCVGMGLLFSNPESNFSTLDWTSTDTLFTLGLGVVFVTSFLLIGQTTQQSGVTTASLSSNLSLVIPVLFGLFIFKNSNKDFTVFNYLGLGLALVSVGLSAIKKSNNNHATAANHSLVWILPLILFFVNGASNTLINYISSTFYQPTQSAFLTTIACTGASVFAMLVLGFRVLFYAEKVSIKSIVGGFILGIFNFLSFYFLLATLQDFGNSAAFVFPIYNILCILVSAFLAFLLFGETLQSLNKLGLALAILSIILISYQEIGTALGH